MSDEDLTIRRRRLTRRELVRRGVVTGGTVAGGVLVWNSPLVQSLEPTATGSPEENCTQYYAVRFEGKNGAICEPLPAGKSGSCLGDSNITAVNPSTGGCNQDVTVLTGADKEDWVVTLPLGCRFISGCGKCANGDNPVDQAETDISVIFEACKDGTKTHGISHIDFIFCC
jgi:hypothetical protein